MEHRRVGNSGLRVSALSIGGWLTFGESVDQQTTGAIVRAAVDGGVNFIDLADVYAAGGAERAIGTALKDFRRESLVISSKLFWPMSEDVNDRGLSRKHIMESVDRSLRNLGMDYLDIYFCHREDPDTPLEETARAMDDLIRRGKVLYWGTSVWKPENLRRAHDVARDRGWDAPIVEQPQYNLLHRWMEKDVAPMARRLGMGLVVWSPLAGGALTGKYNNGPPPGSRATRSRWVNDYLTPEKLERVRQLTRMAEEMGVETSALALAWTMARPGITSVITGATSVAQVRANLQATSVKMTDELARRIDRLFAF